MQTKSIKRLVLASLLAVCTLVVTKAIDTTAFGTNTLFIEAEDADFNHGQYVIGQKIGMDGPYSGGSYTNLGSAADLDFDWHAEGPNAQPYRANTGLSGGKENGTAGSDRGTFQVKDWWTLGWNNGGDWYNYTRNFPTNNYLVYGHLASGGAPINIEVDQITAGFGQADTSQVKKTLGFFAPGRATAGWDSLEIFPLTDTNGNRVTVKLGGTNTLRATLLPNFASDMDYFAFVPITAPYLGSLSASRSNITAVLTDSPTGTAVDATSVIMSLNGAALAATATKSGTLTTIGFKITPVLNADTTNTVSITYKDTAGKSYTETQVFVIGPITTDTVFIESEDADYGHGQFVTNQKIGMDGPYAGGSYAGLGTADDLDFDWHAEGPNAQTYRPDTGLSAGKENGTAGSDRGYFQVTDWWTLGWNNGGDWYNYTRNFPVNTNQYYEGFAHLASGGAAINVRLDKIVSGQGQTDASQVKQTLGYFAPGRATAGWDTLEIFPLVTASGGKTAVQLSGKTTLRITLVPGAAADMDYFAFRPVTIPVAVSSITTQPKSQSITEGNPGSLSVVATTTGAYGLTYQWKKNGVAIAGANTAALNLPVQQLPDSGTKYSVDISTLGAPTVTSGDAVITVTPDKNPPVILSAGSLKAFTGGSEVDLIFDKPLSASTIIPAKFSLNNGATVSGARYVTNSSGLDRREKGVVLSVSALTSGTTYTLTVKGVADAKGNVLTNGTVTFTPSKYSWIGIDDQVLPGVTDDALATSTNGFNLVNGGNAFWTTVDDITMVYESITGDFDKTAQVEWNDPSSNWARAGISARESLNGGQATTDGSGANPASRYQMVISDPAIKFDGTAGNDNYETNRRLQTGGPTDSAPVANGSGAIVTYPNSYVRLKRVGQLFSMYWSKDGLTWRNIGTTDYSDNTLSDTPMPATLFVGPTLGIENGNILGQGGTADQEGAFAARFRQYLDVGQKATGKETYAIGLSFGANELGGALSINDVAGVDAVAQGHWNNLFGNDTAGTPVTGIVAEKAGASLATPVTVNISGSGNTWASQGPRGENNNLMVGEDQILMTGYLDTGNATTTQVTIDKIPTDLTGTGYDVVIYALGGVGARGGAYRITDSTGKVLADYVKAQGPTNPTNFVQAVADPNNYAVGNYIVFKNLKASTIIVEATTDNSLGFSGTPRAPINAIQLVSPSGLLSSAAAPTLAISRTGTSAITITYTGTLQSATAVTGPYTNVVNSPSPVSITISAGAGAKFWRATQ